MVEIVKHGKHEPAGAERWKHTHRGLVVVTATGTIRIHERGHVYDDKLVDHVTHI